MPATTKAWPGYLALAVAASAALLVGWQTFWFLCDDAFIVFRYCSNAFLGHGYVWNAQPFAPVEGYTQFLWVVLLEYVWRWTGIEPPDSANVVSLIFSAGTLLVTAVGLARIDWSPGLRRHQLPIVTLGLALLLSNRTFLAWTSSGMETAMFGFWVALWTYAMVFVRRPALQVTLASVFATAVYFCRPDGLLFLGGTGALALCFSVVAGKRILFGLAPMALVGAHFAWRRSFYGEWLPNTYYAKVIGARPDTGVEYLYSFVLEYGLWWWAVVVALGVLFGVVIRRRDATADTTSPAMRGIRPALAIATLGGHAAYYTFVVGGDHFEYRVYNHLLPVLVLALAWSANQITRRPTLALGILGLQLAVSLPVPWTHWALTHQLEERAETATMKVPIAPHWPEPVRFYAEAFDASQFWLMDRAVCRRHQEHKVFGEIQRRHNPTRELGATIPAEGNPVIVRASVGVPAWVLPHVHVIDYFGLNDWVIARSRSLAGNLMAHARKPPPGYVESFEENLVVKRRKIDIIDRDEPMTDERIRAIEAEWRTFVERPRKRPAADRPGVGDPPR